VSSFSGSVGAALKSRTVWGVSPVACTAASRALFGWVPAKNQWKPFQIGPCSALLRILHMAAANTGQVNMYELDADAVNPSSISTLNLPSFAESSEWLDVPVRIITLNNSVALPHFEEFGFRNVMDRNDLTADFRGSSPADLEEAGFITPLARQSIEALENDEYPRRPYELAKASAVGLFLSHLRVCDKHATTLVLEEDACPINPALQSQFPLALELTKNHTADIIIFGPLEVFEGMKPWKPISVQSSQPGFEPLGSRGFFGTQGVLYTARGCQKMWNHLGPPFDMQIDGALSLRSQGDALFSRPSNTSLKLWIEVGTVSIVQDHSLLEELQPHINGDVERCTVYSMWTGCWEWEHYMIGALLVVLVAYIIGWQAWLWGRRGRDPRNDDNERFCFIFLCAWPPICDSSRAEKRRAPTEATGLIVGS
jgi:hypothetical protein